MAVEHREETSLVEAKASYTPYAFAFFAYFLGWSALLPFCPTRLSRNSFPEAFQPS